jgi:hypothetical protein
MFKVATDSQLAYLGSLIAKSGSSTVLSPTLSVSEASALIEQLKGAAAELVPEGIYRRSIDGVMFRVQSSESGRRYAKTLLTTGGWDYERGAVFTLKLAERLTLQQVIEWGLDTGVCAVCGRLLSNAKSVAAGIGPICAKGY